MQSFCATKPDTSTETDVRGCEELRAALAELSASAQQLKVARFALPGMGLASDMRLSHARPVHVASLASKAV